MVALITGRVPGTKFAPRAMARVPSGRGLLAIRTHPGRGSSQSTGVHEKMSQIILSRGTQFPCFTLVACL